MAKADGAWRDVLLWGSVEICSHFGSRPLWNVGSVGVRGEKGVGAKGLHEVRPLNSSRTTGAACMSASVWGTRRFCCDGNGTGGDATRRVYRPVWRPGRLNPLGFEGIANFRDVAGIDPTQPGMKVAGGRLKRGMVFRTAAWTAASQSDAEKIVKKLRVRTYVDLRQGTGSEAHWQKFALSPSELLTSNPRRINFNLARNTHRRDFTEAELNNRLSPNDRRSQTALWYQVMWREPSAGYTRERHLSYLNVCSLFQNDDMVRGAMQAFTDPAKYPIAFGCMTGKDRTGLLAMLLLSALGASREDIMTDYLLSNHAATHNAECSEAAWRPLGGGKWDDCTDDGSQDNRYNVFPSVMEFTFSVIDKECGGVLQYLDGIGFGPQRVAMLRRTLVESSLPSSH